MSLAQCRLVERVYDGRLRRLAGEYIFQVARWRPTAVADLDENTGSINSIGLRNGHKANFPEIDSGTGGCCESFPIDVVSVSSGIKLITNHAGLLAHCGKLFAHHAPLLAGVINVNAGQKSYCDCCDTRNNSCDSKPILASVFGAVALGFIAVAFHISVFRQVWRLQFRWISFMGGIFLYGCGTFLTWRALDLFEFGVFWH